MARPLTRDEAAHLKRLGRRITKVEAEVRALYDERLAAYRTLVDDGVKQAEIAKAAGVGTSAVGFALHHHAKKQAAPPAQPHEDATAPDPAPLAATPTPGDPLRV